jgi:hypothetical protein
MVAENNLKRLAPEFGPAVIKDMMKADLPVVDALTAKAYFENAAELGSIMTGSIGRRRVLAPRLDVARKTRVLQQQLLIKFLILTEWVHALSMICSMALQLLQME